MKFDDFVKKEDPDLYDDFIAINNKSLTQETIYNINNSIFNNSKNDQELIGTLSSIKGKQLIKELTSTLKEELNITDANFNALQRDLNRTRDNLREEGLRAVQYLDKNHSLTDSLDNSFSINL